MKEAYKKLVRRWLALGAFLVIAMVVIGGITRLTHSGLSMVNWKPLTGILPPLTEVAWEAEFENYKQFPEYQKINFHFELSDFKQIFWWEYIHRILGRLIGIIFILPYAFFLFKKVFDRKWNIRLIVLFILGGLQGVIGWFMVKSGLVDNPAVSHFRLAIHFITALSLYSYILWLYWDSSSRVKKLAVTAKIKNWTIALLSLVTLQIVYGAFVAGMKAGLIFNTWPLMGNSIISPLALNSFSEMGLLSLVEDPITVQFIHRTLPYVILICLVILWRKAKSEPMIKNSILLLLLIWFIQSLIGVFTLLMRVPVSLGVLHQLGAVLFLTYSWMFFYRQLSYPASDEKMSPPREVN